MSEKAMLKMKRIAVVGMSDDPSRPAGFVPEFLLDHGKQVIPVNPKLKEAFGKTAYSSLAEVPGPIDVVLVFRRSEFCAAVAQEAAAVGAKGLWLQSGITSTEAREIAQSAKMMYVEDRCMMVELDRQR